MKLKKSIPALLCAAVLTAALTGCVGSQVREYTEPTPDPDATAAPTEAPAETDGSGAQAADYTYAYEKHNPDDLVMTIDGLPVYWKEYFYWLMSSVSTFDYYYGGVSDWNEACAMDSSMSNAEYTSAYALDYLTQYRSLEHNVKALGAELSEEDLAAVEETWNSYVDNYTDGDAEAFINDYLIPSFLDEELYRYLITVERIYYAGFDAMYGEDGERFSDEETREYADSAGLMFAKHILIMTIDSATEEELTGEALEEKTALAEDILAQLQSAGDLNTKFDELMNEYSEDTGLPYYPEGYAFSEGEMVTEFEEAVKGLEDGQISGLVKSAYGYHIIMRIPFDPDMPVEYYSADESYTLRHMAALSVYDSYVTNWSGEAEVVWEPEFENLDVAALFAK